MSADMDFIGFSFNGKHTSEFGLYRVSDGKRYNDTIVPTIQDKTQQIPGGDGTYFFNSYHTQKPFPLKVAFDEVSEEQLRGMKQWLNGKECGDLIFDEEPYKKYCAKVQSAPQLQYICFEKEEEEVTEELFENNDFSTVVNNVPEGWSEQGDGGSSSTSDGVYSYTVLNQNQYMQFGQEGININDLNYIELSVEVIFEHSSSYHPYTFQIIINNNTVYEEEITVNNPPYQKKISNLRIQISNPSLNIFFKVKNYDIAMALHTFRVKNPSLKGISKKISRVYKGEGTINLIAYNPYARSVHKYLSAWTSSERLGNVDQWQPASGILASNSFGYDTFNSGNGSITVYNPGDMPTDYKLLVMPPTTPIDLTISSGDSSITLTSVTLASEDSQLVFDTRTQLIKGANSSGITRNLYNRYISAGDFFKIPISTSTAGTTISISAMASGTSVAVSTASIEYDYLYY